MNAQSNRLVLEINRDGDWLAFLLKAKNITVPGSTKLSAQQLQSIIDDVDDTMHGGGATRQEHGEIAITDLPVAGDEFAFSRITAKIVPYPIQRELKRLLGHYSELQINTNELSLPWEMLEFFEFVCPVCSKVVVDPPTCPNCARVQFPDPNDPPKICVCGFPINRILETWSPNCKHESSFDELVIEPYMHIGLSFALERASPEFIQNWTASSRNLAHDLRPMSVLLIENPKGLHYSDKETEELRSFFEKNSRIVRAHILGRENATKKSIQQALENEGPFDIVHFVGHGVFLPERPQKSYLVLSAEEQLELNEIPRIFAGHIPELIILNGCQTAMVGEINGNKVGFPVTFLNMGAKSFIGTISPVADPQACYLILYLYHKILQGAPLNQALLLAKREISCKEFDDVDGDWFVTRTTGFLYSWSSYVIYGDGHLRPRHFEIDITWKDLANSALENMKLLSGLPGRSDRASYRIPDKEEYPNRIHLPSKFISEGKHPIFSALGAEKKGVLETCYYQSSFGRHIIGLVDLENCPRDIVISKHIAERILGREEELETIVPFIEQMTTNEAVCMIFILGIEDHPNQIGIIEQIEQICEMSNFSIKFVLDGDRSFWARIFAQHQRNLNDLIFDYDLIIQETTGVLLSRFQEWANSLSKEEIASITKEKWDPKSSHLYISRRDIEDQIDEFLRRNIYETSGFCVLGETGRGKTNLLCRMYIHHRDSQLHDRERVTVFTTARGLFDEAGASTDLKAFIERVILGSILGKKTTDLHDNTELLHHAFRILEKETSGRPVELLLIIDAINELPEIVEADFIDGLKNLIDKSRDFYGRKFFISLIVSSRTFSWRSMWNGQELDIHKYFPNLDLEGGEIEENLLDFDLSGEARDAYTKAGIRPRWENLSDELRDLFRTPFFLHIVRTISKFGAIGEITGTYYDVMAIYEDLVLLKNVSSKDALLRSEIRQTIINTMVELIALGEKGEKDFFSLSEEVTFRKLRDTAEGYSAEELEETIFDFCEESVLEARGGQLRFSFDLFFDYLFRDYLVQRFEKIEEPSHEWLNTIEKYHRSEYYRHGVSAALANEIASSPSTEEAVKLISTLLPQQPETYLSPSYRQLVQDGMISFGEDHPKKLAKILYELYEKTKEPETITEVACAVIGSVRVQRDKKQDLNSVIERVLRDYLTGSRHAQDKKARRNIINMVGGLGKVENGIESILDIVGTIIGIDYETGDPPESFRAVFDIFLDPSFQQSLSEIRYHSIRTFRESDDRVRTLLRVGTAAMRTPLSVLRIFLSPKYIIVLRHAGATLRRIEMCLEIVIKGAFLWFTEQRGSKEEKFQLSIDTLDQYLHQGLLNPLISLFNNPDTSEEYKKEIIENLSFYIGLIGIWPEINRLFSYSEEGLDQLSIVLQRGEGTDLAEMLSLLDIDKPLSEVPNARNRLRQLFLEPDAFRNYLGMLATIVQGTADFTQVEGMLGDLLELRFDGKGINYGEMTIPKHIKVSREVFSIFTYMIRRTAQLSNKQLNQLFDFVENMIEYFFDFDTSHSNSTDYLQYFQELELFGKEDPFNPLLPLGVASQHRGYTKIRLGDHQNYVIHLVDKLYDSRLKDKYRLIDRILRELIPMSYFSPMVVVGTLEEFIKKRQSLVQEEPDIRTSLVYVIKSLNHVISDQIEKMFGYLENYAKKLTNDEPRIGKKFAEYINELEKEALGSSLSKKEIDYLYRSIDVFGGHDLITTLFLEYENIRRIVVPFIQEEIEKVETASELVHGVAKTLISLFASQEINFSLTKIIYQSLPEEIRNP